MFTPRYEGRKRLSITCCENLATNSRRPLPANPGRKLLFTRDSRAVEIARDSHYAPAMPIYEFHCAKCGEDSEVLVRSSNWEGTPCPHCGSKKLSKKLSVFASSVGPDGGGTAPACGMKGGGGGCCGCAAGRPHKH